MCDQNKKVAEKAQSLFITGVKPNLTGLILAGSAAFKQDLYNSSLLDKRLKEIVIKQVDISYGGENGLHQAIELSKEVLGNIQFVEEKKGFIQT